MINNKTYYTNKRTSHFYYARITLVTIRNTDVKVVCILFIFALQKIFI